MSGKNMKKKTKQGSTGKILKKPNSIKKTSAEDKRRIRGKMKLALPKDLQEKVEAEKNPENVVAAALADYYGRGNRRNEIALQKEIDNNIIEIQRRHISDLKDQLDASNRNYEELMKTYQAYMLQVQPLVEAGQLQSAAALKPAAEMQTEGRTEDKTKAQQNTAAETVEKAASATAAKKAAEEAAASENRLRLEKELKEKEAALQKQEAEIKNKNEELLKKEEELRERETKIQTKNEVSENRKRWYEFWK